jgi:hypothetical protein
VCTPEDAFRCFMGTDIELLVAGNCLLRKEEQDPALRQDYKGVFELDRRARPRSIAPDAMPQGGTASPVA